MPTLHSHTQLVPTLRDCQAAQANRTSQSLSISVSFPTHGRKKTRTHNITYTQAGVSPLRQGKLCFVGQVSAKFKVQFFVASSVVKCHACV